ncbi:MAG TPA: fibronectin type III domain-containing protein [Verrucomicrobiae bacterium]|nr:fibronectin type III domain-containing protein [Verrucomicrobiae bacterium]
MLSAQLPVQAAQSVTLTWNPSVATNVAGYRVYSGTASHSYATTNIIGAATNTTISSLVEGRTYYFAATTYDSAGNESAFSSETSYTVPVPPVALGAPARAGSQFSFSVSGATGSQYVVQASTNLVNWVSLQTNTAPFMFVDTKAACFSQRYYRTYYLSP